jgi:outer membrane protein assembly factor BamB
MRRSVYFLALCLVLNAASAADWPQWRGLRRDGLTPETFPNLAALPDPGSAVWKIKIGGGFSSPVVAGEKLVFLDEDGKNEVVHCLDAKTGKVLWQMPYAQKFQDEWGAGPRATPIIDGDRVYIQSCDGHFRCLALENGKEKWSVSFEKDFGVKFLGSKANEGTASRRGNNGSPVVDGASVIVPVGATDGATVVSFDKMTGAVQWKSGSEETAYSSLMVADLAGRRQVVAFAADSLMGMDRANGTLLWRVPLRTNAKRHAATPVIAGDRVIVNSHSIGLLCLKISAEGGGFQAKREWLNPQLKINLSTPVLTGNTLFSQGTSGQFVAVDLGTGRILWSKDGFGKENSSVIAAGNKLIVLTDAGQLYLLEANPVEYKELASAQIAGKNWNYPALSGGCLYVRDGRELACHKLAN